MLTVFDLDHTLLKGNSSYYFGAYLYQQGWISRFTLLRLLAGYAAHRFLGWSMHALHRQACHLLFTGKSFSLLHLEVNRFLDLHLESLIRPSLIHEIRSPSLLLSSSPHFLVEQIGRRLGIDASMGSDYSVWDGRIVGVERVLDGKEKYRLLQEQQVPFEQITFYTDSYLDLPVMQAVGTAVAVAPDRKLRTEATKREWRVMEE